MYSTLVRGLATGLVLVVMASTAAAAAPLEKEHFQDVWSEVEEGFCDRLDVRIDGDVRGSILVVPRGRERLPYFTSAIHGTIVWTNLANGLTVTNRFAVREMDLEIVDNGDGTLTLTVLATGADQYRGPDGRLAFTNPGQIRYQLLIDHGGTPTDPSDDEFLEDLGLVKGSTGRNDTEGRDFCDDVVALIG